MAKKEKAQKNKKGFLSGTWGTVAKIGVGVCLSMVGMPLMADMGTWMVPFHDPTNMRTQAFQNTIAPYTSWIPYHVGFTEEGGLFYDAMTSFIGPELNKLQAISESSYAADSMYSRTRDPFNDAALGEDKPEVITLDTEYSSGLDMADMECELLGTCGL